ncbi:MAG: hypothetical protein WBY94_20700, partial [Polyangiaceae bacterium]
MAACVPSAFVTATRPSGVTVQAEQPSTGLHGCSGEVMFVVFSFNANEPHAAGGKFLHVPATHAARFGRGRPRAGGEAAEHGRGWAAPSALLLEPPSTRLYQRPA